MEPRKKCIMLITTALLVSGCFAKPVIGETIWVDAMNGNDSGPGTKDKPLRTFEKIATIVNESNEPGPTTIKVNPGVYDISETVLLKNERAYTRENRLTIEAAVLPDDPNWHPRMMPVILATIKPTPIKDCEEYYSIIVEPEVNHVTIRGLKFLGNPAYRTRSFAVFRNGMNLEDLVITQCVFAGDKNTFPYNVCIVAKGNETILDHNIFYNCETCVVFWDAEGGVSKGNAMRYCIVDGASTAAVWTTQTAEDFDFHHNVITRCGYFWMRAPGCHQKYRIRDSVITDCGTYSGYGTASELSGPTGPEVTFDEVNVTKQGTVTLKKCEIPKNRRSADLPRDYLHIVPGTVGYEIGAGIFKSVKIRK
jgi:hypothetical protein